MKILIITQYYYPEQFQINEIAPELVRLGNQVTVLTGLPNYPKGKIYDGYQNSAHNHEFIDGVEIIRCDCLPRKTGVVNLIINYLSFAQKSTKMINVLDSDYDLVFCYELSPITVLKPAIKYCKIHDKPLLCYCLDLWPESALAHVKFKNGLLYKAISYFSKKYYQKCDRIAVTSKPFIQYLHVKNGIDIDKMSYIPQHASSNFLDINFNTEEREKTNFMYAGNLGAGQRVDVILKAAAEMQSRDDFIIHLVGDGSQRAELERMTLELNLKNKVIFHGNQRRENMANFYKLADALLLTLRGDNAVGDTMPGKLQMYMSVGKPIFGAINGAAMQVIDEAKCGACVPAEDTEGLAKIMLDYIEHPEAYSECGEHARIYFKKNFTMDVFMESLEKEMRSLV